MESKRGLSDLVASVLMIILVLAAVIIVWQVVLPLIKGKTGEISSQATCIGINLEIIKANNNTGNITVKRGIGGKDADVADVKFLAEGTASNHTNTAPALTQLETKIYNVAASKGTAGKKIEVAAILNNEANSVCNIVSSLITAP